MYFAFYMDVSTCHIMCDMHLYSTTSPSTSVNSSPFVSLCVYCYCLMFWFIFFNVIFIMDDIKTKNNMHDYSYL